MKNRTLQQFRLCLCLLILLSCRTDLPAQLDQCKGLPRYIAKMGLDPRKAYLSTTERNLVGLALIESEQPGNPEARILQVKQDKSWTNKGYLGAICTDQQGNSYILSAGKVNTLLNPFDKQNRVYKVDSQTGVMTTFVDLPMAVKPGPFNPFGVLGIFFDCSTNQLLVSTVAGSSEKKELGAVYKVDVKSKAITKLISEKDVYGLAVQIHKGKRTLFVADIRTSTVYAAEVDGANNLLSELKKEFSILGVGPRGDDKIRKIRFAKDGSMQLSTVLFYYNLTAPTDEQQSRLTYVFNSVSDRWELRSID